MDLLFERSKPITIKQQVTEPDGIGGITEQWLDFWSGQGFLDMITGTDLTTQASNSFIVDSTHLCVIFPPIDKGINNAMRLYDGEGQFYDITYVDNPLGLDDHLELYLSIGRGPDV